MEYRERYVEDEIIMGIFSAVKVMKDMKETNKYEYKSHSIVKEYEINNNSYGKGSSLPTMLGTDRHDDNILKRMTKSQSYYYEEGIKQASEDKNTVITRIKKKDKEVTDFYNELISEKSNLINQLAECCKVLKEKNKEDSGLFKACMDIGSVFSEDLRYFVDEERKNFKKVGDEE